MSPSLQKESSGKSPYNHLSPPILDFLEEDIFSAVTEDINHQRIKFKSEFVKRDRQESEDSNAEAES